jgi:hypothetical protein
MNQGGTVGGQEMAGQRRSHALQSLARHLETNPGLQVADFGGLNQQNLDFITGFGHRLYAEDLIASYEWFFSQAERSEGMADEKRIADFLASTIGFAKGSVGAVLAWDRLQFLFPGASGALVERLKSVMAPGGLLLAIFHPEQLAKASPLVCRITDQGGLTAMPRPPARPAVKYNARAIEKLFGGFASVKFYMTRDSLQEVLIRR